MIEGKRQLGFLIAHYLARRNLLASSMFWYKRFSKTFGNTLLVLSKQQTEAGGRATLRRFGTHSAVSSLVQPSVRLLVEVVFTNPFQIALAWRFLPTCHWPDKYYRAPGSTGTLTVDKRPHRLALFPSAMKRRSRWPPPHTPLSIQWQNIHIHA